MNVRGVEIDVTDAQGFNDFTIDGVFFSHYPLRARSGEHVYKVWWPNIPGAGRLYYYDTADRWNGHSGDSGSSFRGVADKAAAVERMVDRRWDAEDGEAPPE